MTRFHSVVVVYMLSCIAAGALCGFGWADAPVEKQWTVALILGGAVFFGFCLLGLLFLQDPPKK